MAKLYHFWLGLACLLGVAAFAYGTPSSASGQNVRPRTSHTPSSTPAVPTGPAVDRKTAADFQQLSSECTVIPKGPDHDCTLAIGVSFLPAWKRIKAEDGSEQRVSVDAFSVFQVPTSEVALVLVDTWNNIDPPEGQEPPAYYQKIIETLDAARRHGVTVIHAPNHPIVERYTQYQLLRAEIACFLQESRGKRPYYHWPPDKNDLQTSGLAVRERYRRSALTPEEWEIHRENAMADVPSAKCQGISGELAAKSKQTTGSANSGTLDISRLMRPLENEYVLASHDEFRYVLFKHGVKMVIYVGGATNECLMQRATGINSLVGTDGSRSPFTIVVLEDATSSMPTSRFDAQTINAAMLDYLKLKLAFVSQVSDLRFLSASNMKPAHDLIRVRN